MKFEVDTDTVLEKIAERITANTATAAANNGMSEEEVAATLVLNKKKIAQDAQNLAVFFTSLYVQAPAATEPEEFKTDEEQLPL